MTAPARKDSPTRRITRAVQVALRARGYEVRRVPGANTPSNDDGFGPASPAGFAAEAAPIIRRHDLQTRATVTGLNDKYREPVIGRVRVWELIEWLGQCVDPTDRRLLCTSQQTHVLQVLDGMEADGISDPDLLLAALVHDLGKLLLLTDEDPANIVGMNTPIGAHDDGIGLDNCVLQWNHDEFGYSRFKDHVPDHIAWLIRYHSIELDACASLMDERDRRYADQYLRVFSKHDHGTKSPYRLPKRPLRDYRDLIEQAFPAPIDF